MAQKTIEDQECCSRQQNFELERIQAGKLATQKAAELLAYLEVKGIERPESACKDPEKKEANQKSSTLTLQASSPPIQTSEIVGLGLAPPSSDIQSSSSTWLNKSRLDWVATTRDVNKDLNHAKVEIAKHDQKPEASLSSASLPFHTLLVQWKLSFVFPVYTPRLVHGIMSRFGTIDHMGSLSHNSAFVVYHHEYHAVKSLHAKFVGFSYCPLIIRWWYLERYKFPVTSADDVKREDLATSDGRLERNSKRHLTQIKREFWKKAIAMSYDVRTFRP